MEQNAPSSLTYPIEHTEDIRAMEEQDRTNPPALGQVLFVGSSIFRMWTSLAEQMAPLPVQNRAFGGSRTWELVHYEKTLVLPCAPRIVVCYCGSNDINVGERSSEAIAGRLTEFTRFVHEALPESLTFLVSIIRAPQKREFWDVVDGVNTRLAQRVGTNDLESASFIDVNPALLDKGGGPDMALYEEDALHLLPAAYERMAAVIKPVLLDAWNATKQ